MTKKQEKQPKRRTLKSRIITGVSGLILSFSSIFDLNTSLNIIILVMLIFFNIVVYLIAPDDFKIKTSKERRQLDKNKKFDQYFDQYADYALVSGLLLFFHLTSLNIITLQV